MENLNKKILLTLICIILLFSLASLASTKTTCKRNSGEPKCDITITINIAFFGASQDQIDDWVDDIEDVWNGHTYGECKCEVHYEVNWNTTTNCTQAMAQGYHCIMVTAGLAKDTSNKTYRGYMYGVSSNGSSTMGWWSSGHMNQPLPGVEGNIHDAAHEAGHMMGLPDDYNASAGYYGQNIMGRTWSENATPTQEQIDATVENNCEGEDAECPDECCCGDGKIDEDKGEDCDPMADPTGCEEDEQCTENCTCIEIPAECGDGLITGAEECDYNADPTGCKKDEECNEDCECEKKPTITVEITDPDNGDEIDKETEIDLDIDSDYDIDKIRFYIDDEKEFTDYESPWKWFISPWLYEDDDDHTLKVVVYDEEGNTAEDEIEFETFWWDHCGNGILDDHEECDLGTCEVNYTCDEYCRECEEIEE